MNVRYSADVDALYIKLSDAKIKDSDEDEDGNILDYDEQGNIVGIEILNASKMSGEKFTAYRKHLGWSQEELGKIYGRTRWQVSNWERGKSPIPHDTALLTCLLANIQNTKQTKTSVN